MIAYKDVMTNKSAKKKERRRLFSAMLKMVAMPRYGRQRFAGVPKSIVILVSERYGDMILLTPLIKQLRKLFPAVVLHAIAFRKQSFDFFKHDKNIDKVFYVKSNYLKSMLEILSKRYDVLFNPKDSLSFNFLLQSYLIRAGFKVAFKHDYHERLFNCLLDLDYYNQVAVRNCFFLSVFHPFQDKGLPCRPYVPPMKVSEEIRNFLHHMPTSEYIGINISAGSAVRYWNKEKWIALVNSFPGSTFIVFSAPKDIEQKAAIDALGGNILVAPVTKNFYEVGLLVSSLKLLVTPDTSLVHVAACYNIPLVGLYRNRFQDRTRFMPLSDSYELVISPTLSVKDIDVSDVVSALQTIMKKI